MIGRLEKTTPFLVFAGVFTIYLIAALKAETPGRNDGLVYYHAAKSLIGGQGLTLPYVWNYLASPQGLPVPAFGYWMPLASFLSAGSMSVFGPSVWAALLPNCLFVAALALIAHQICRHLGGSVLWCLFAAFGVAFNPLVIKYGTTTQAVLPSAAFGCLALMMVGMKWWHQKTRPQWYEFLAVGMLAGLAALSRGDGQLVLVVILAALTWRRGKVGDYRGLRSPVLLMLLGWMLVMAPWAGRNLTEFGVPSPPGATKALLVTDYEDIYSFAKPLTATGHLASAVDDPLGTIAVKMKSIGNILMMILVRYGPLLLVAGFGLAGSYRPMPGWLVVVVGHIVVCLLFYGLVGTAVGQTSSQKASLVVLPLLAGGAAYGLSVLGQRRRVVIAGALVVLTAWSAIPMVHVVLDRDKGYSWLGEVVLATEGEPSPVVMARKPWRVWEDAGFPAIQVPSDGLDAVVMAAGKFGATHLYLRYAAERPALSGIYDGTHEDVRFEMIAEKEGHRLFLLHLDSREQVDGLLHGK